MHPRPGPHPGPRKPCLAGAIDLAGPFQEPPDRFEDPDIELVAEDFRLWTPAAAAYDLILCLEVLERIPEFETIFELGEVALRPKGQLIFTHEPLIEAHPDFGRARVMTDALRFRRPTQAVLDLSRRHGMKPKFVKDLVVGRREGEPRILQLLRL